MTNKILKPGQIKEEKLKLTCNVETENVFLYSYY
jgi:hypothetical protein